METTEVLQQILSKLDSLETSVTELKIGQAKLEVGQTKLEAGQTKLEAGQTKLEESVSRIEDRILQIEDRTLRIEDRTLRIEITLENDIAKKIGALFDGYKLNTQKLDHIKAVVDDIDSTVSALDIITYQNTNDINKLKIVK